MFLFNFDPNYFSGNRSITSKKFEWTLKQSDKKVRSNLKRFWCPCRHRTRISISAPKLRQGLSRWTFPGCDAWWATDLSLSLSLSLSISIYLSISISLSLSLTHSLTDPSAHSLAHALYVSHTHSYINNNDDKLFLVVEHNWWSEVCSEHKLLFCSPNAHAHAHAHVPTHSLSQPLSLFI